MCSSAYFSTEISGRYKCIRRLGRGGSSAVYLCVDNHIGKLWAVKLILPEINNYRENKDLFMSEISTLKSLDYYMFPRITDAFIHEKQIGIVTDYIEGETLESYLIREGPIPEFRALIYFEELLKALIYLHTRSPGILYLDMKPANIMITPDGQLKLIDFGIATNMLTKCRCYGSKGYAPPEQYVLNSVLDEKADVFALGMTLYAMLTASVPSADYEQQFQNIKNNANISKNVKDMILKCISKERLVRPTTEQLLSMLGVYKSKYKGTVAVVMTAIVVSILSFTIVYFGVKTYKDGMKSRYAKEMISTISEYMENGEYTHHGIRIICGYIDGDFLDRDIKSKYSYEVARYYFEVMKEYSTAEHYFELADDGDYPEAKHYIELCREMRQFSNKELENRNEY